MDNKQNDGFKPFIPASQTIPEMTVTSIIMGILLAVLFGAANAYLGLRVGMTVSASIPAAVISMGLIRVILRRDSILENNMVQTIGSAGESLAAGAIFTLPAIYMWMDEGADVSVSLPIVSIICICGGILGILFMILLRSALIVKEHGTLPYPEGTACAEVLIAGEEGGTAAGTVFAGLGIASLYKFVTDGLKIFPSEISYDIKGYPGAAFGVDVLPSLLGVGYICGPRIASFMFSGSVIAWLALMPLIKMFGGDAIVFPADISIAELGTGDLWSKYVRYIGAGAVAAGGIISLIKSLPLIVRTFKENVQSLVGSKGNASDERTSRDLSHRTIGIGVLIVILVLAFTPGLKFNIISVLLIVLLGFFFATVSSRMVGLVGSSNNPVSGMAIASLLITTFLLKATGNVGTEGMVTAIMIGTIICIIAAMAGDISQDLKTGYIVGATPKKQQIGEVIGTFASGLAIAGILELLNKAWGYGSAELPAPQATLMKMVIEGVMGGNLPWNLVFVGIAIAVVVEILRIPVLPVAIGIYLPIHLNAAIMVGGLIKLYIDKKKFASEEDRAQSVSNGILYSSGLIAGEGLVGILLAVFAVIKVGEISLGEAIDLSARGVSLGDIGSIVFFILLILTVFRAAKVRKQS